MIFSSKKKFREVVHSHAIRSCGNLKITKNDNRRVYVRCVDEGCEWYINAPKLKNESLFQIREYNPNHKCGRSYHVKNVKAQWLSKKYEEAFRSDPKRDVKGFRTYVIKNIRCNMSMYQTYRAKKTTVKAIKGYDDQYAKL